MGLSRLALLAAASLAAGVTVAAAGDCPGNPKALGVSRTLVVDPREHARIGTMSYVETLPLAAKEVVLTFDDGPLSPHSDRILDILAAECVKATYFIVGAMARANPHLVRRAYDDGHTIGTHSMSHPIPFVRQGVERTRQQIDDGIKATAAALGESRQLAPFFRFPGFGRTDPAESYLTTIGLQAWGADIPADDWRRIDGNEVARRALRRLEALGKGIVLLHDIHQRTVDALPILLRELKARGYRVVHVVPATPERPATVTAAAEWRMRPSVLSAPVFALADVQEPSGEFLTDKSAAELCALQTPQRERRLAKLRIEKTGAEKSTVGASAERPRETKSKPRESKPAETKVAGISLFGILIGGDVSEEKRTAGGEKSRGRKGDDGKKKVAGAKLATPDIHSMR
jgi:peptidoglycan-N-acetylglucosamine deacetylase